MSIDSEGTRKNLKSETPTSSKVIWIFVAVVVVVSFGVMYGPRYIEKFNTEKEKQAVLVFSQTAVEARLKHPGGSKFPSNLPPKISGSTGMWKVEGYVDAQTGFGALDRVKYVCDISVSSDGKMMSAERVKFFD